MNGDGGNPTAGDEWRRHWPLVLACAAGFSLYGVASYSIGLFMEPLAKEFGWSRAEISIATFIPAMLVIFLAPLGGAMIDRWGSRRLALPSVLFTGVALAMISLTNGAIWQWYALWTFYGLVTIGIKAAVWTTGVSRAFVTGRGLALGVAMCGGAAVQIVAPPLTQWLVDGFGWRQAYIMLGLGWSAPCLVLVLLCLHEPADRPRQSNVVSSSASVPGGLTLGEAFRDVALIRIGISTLLTMFVGTAILIHQVPILNAAGVSRAEAAWLASLAGAAGIVGKIFTGWLSDHWDASLVGAITLVVPAAAYLALLQESTSSLVIVLSMMVIGYTAGSKMQISAYLTGKFGGMRHYGKIFGVMTSLIGIGGGIGTVAAGAVFDHFGTYKPLLILGVASSFVCGALIFRLGTPRQLSPEPTPPAQPSGV